MLTEDFVKAFDRLVPIDKNVGAGDAEPNKVPSWLVKILSYTESAVHGFEDFSELRGFYALNSRGNDIASKIDMMSSTALRHSNVILYLPRGNLQTKLEGHLYKSIPIDQIMIVNVAEMNGVIDKLQEILYEQC